MAREEPAAGRPAKALFYGFLLALAGCEAPAAVLTNSDLGWETAPGGPALINESRQKALLSGSEQAEVLDAMRDAMEGKRPVNPPRRARGGLRWSDIELAVEEAVIEIDATVVETFPAEDGELFRFLFRTIENYPGEVIARHVGGKKVYELDIWIGRFPNEPYHVERTEKLRRCVKSQMKRLGSQKWFDD